MKNLAWQKRLRRQAKIAFKNKEKEFYNQEEISLLFPNLSGEDREMKITLQDGEKKIYFVEVPAALYENDILEELKKYKDVPIPGFRKGFVEMTLVDFRYGKNIRESLIHSNYTPMAKDKAAAMDMEINEKNLISSAFNLKKENGCSFNIIFYDKESQYQEKLQEFMENQTKSQEQENETN
jgi:hypothetical protein